MKIRIAALLVAFSIVFSILAAVPVGSWNLYPSFTLPLGKVIETGEKVYYLAGGGLFSYDKGTQESFSYTVDNSLSDYYVSNIFYDRSGERLAVCYSNGNIDILSDDGSLINMSDIRDASVSSSKAINDVAWDNDRLYVATGFGVVAFDVSKRKVIDSGNYGNEVTAIGVTDELVIISSGDDLLSINKGARINKLENWKKIASPGKIDELAGENTSVLYGRNGIKVLKLIFSEDNSLVIEEKGYTYQPFIITEKGIGYVDGNYIVAGGEVISLPENVSGGMLGALDPSVQIWTLDTEGITSYIRSGNTWGIINGRVRPYSFSVREASFIIPDKSGERIYFTTLGPTEYRKALSTENEGIFTRQQTTLLCDGNICDVAARGVELGNVAAEFIPAAESRGAATTRLAENPADKDTYFIGTGNDGLYKVTAGKFVGKYDSSNAPMSAPWGCRVYEVSFDRSGNMWVGADGLTPSTGIMVLPSAKKDLNPSEVKRSDWYIPDLKGFENGKDIRIFHCDKSPVIFIFSSNINHCFVAYHTNGTPDNFDDDKAVLWNDLTDIDGKSFSPERVTAIAEDKDGKVWIGTTEGIIEISSPADALDSNLRVRRLKIDHGDGTGLADYLAGTDIVLDISVDGANRKWVATAASGVYLVNPAGNEILKHFTASNSPLPSQKVNAVFASGITNSVYFATPEGVIEYGNDATMPSDDFSSIKVYPNPVTPDYGGEATVEGLMDGALVKIADSSGTVVWQGHAEGGMITWNMTNSSGKRVRTGVYYIFVSSSANGVSKGAVAKIMVVN
ncbi:MAG: hypothetical protein K2M11_00985 [Paramuribaculum sp.]|nr:hypothetical protein [Paramuribaculum sp.]